MDANDKLSLIREYLSISFPDHPIAYRWDFDRKGYHFRVDTPDGRVKHNILLSRELVDDHPPDLILAHFRENDLRGRLEEAGKRRVLVTSKGISYAGDS